MGTLKQIRTSGMTAAAVLIVALVGGAAGGALALGGGGGAAPVSPPADVRVDTVAGEATVAPTTAPVESLAPALAVDVDQGAPAVVEQPAAAEPAAPRAETAKDSADRAEKAADRAEDAADRASEPALVATPKPVATPQPTPKPTVTPLCVEGQTQGFTDNRTQRQPGWTPGERTCIGGYWVRTREPVPPAPSETPAP